MRKMTIENSRRPTFKWKLKPPLLVLILLIASGVKFSASSRMDFDRQTGEYRNILVALQPSLNASDCTNILEEIKSIFTEASGRLGVATNARAKFGSVKILIPSNWTMSVCSTTSDEAVASDSYDDADIKVSGKHVLANAMPFTRQYRNCGEKSDDIFLPSEFLLSPELNASMKASLLLHEWAKFRYGVYEEHGYFEDDKYPACYSSSGTLRLTSCADISLERLADFTSANCTNALELNRQNLLSQLNGASTSMMSFPDIPNVKQFCTNATHNKFANTKQNAYCDRRSVSDVVLKHEDFVSRLPKNSSTRQNVINFQIIQHRTTNFEAGYAFVIEDSDDIRNQSRLLYVKQSIVQMLSLVQSSSQILLWTFSGRVSNGQEYFGYATEAVKELFVEKIPNVTVSSFVSKLSPQMTKQAGSPNDLEFALRTVTNTLNKLANYKWEIFLITSAPSTAFGLARNIVHANSHSLTVLTYDLDPAWLQLYTTTAVRNVISLPKCDLISGSACHGKVYSLFLDAFMDADRSKTTPQYYQKIAETEVNKNGSITVVIPQGISAVPSDNFHILLPKFLANDQISFRSPSGATCTTSSSVSKYDLVVRMNSSLLGCGFQVGTWTVDLSQVAQSSNTHLVQVILSSSASLQVKGSLGIPRESQIFPSSRITPAYVRVTNTKDQPVIHADVQMSISSSTNLLWNSHLVLSDDGLDPDVIKDDGVYSAYIQSYSPNSSSHNAQITVNTLSTETVAVVSMTSGPTAAFLNITGPSKCCGSFVPVGSTSTIGTSRYTSLLPGFHTAEDFDPSTLPPSRIDHVKVSNDDDAAVTLHFMAPGSSLTTGTVAFYEACCGFIHPSTDTEESSCHRISPPSDCTPVQSGLNQTCRVSREGIYQDFLSQLPFTPPTTIPLVCGIRGVNSNSIAGGLSSNLLEILVSLPLLTDCESKPKASKCNSLSDDCLPITVFWGLIGCICGLLVIILALIICFCRSAAKKKSSQEVLMSRGNLSTRSETPHLPDKDSPLYKVYVNKAYIQDADGQMRMVAADGELLPSDFEGPTSSSSRPTISGPIPSVRRRSVSVSDMNRERDLSNPAWGGSSPAVQEDMPVYKPHSSANAYAQAQGNLYTETAPTRFATRTPVPIPKNRLSRKSSGYANSNIDRNSSQVEQLPVSSISGAIGDPQVPVYASVNRNGRRPLSNTNQPVGSLLNAGGTSTFMRPTQKESTPERNGIVTNRFSRPSSGYQSEYNPSLPRSRPPSRLDAFPSSDSDTYSDMSRGIPMAPRPPPVPPPFPGGDSSDLPKKPKNSILMRNSADRLNVQPRVGNRSSNNLPPIPPPKYVPPPPAPPSKSNAAIPQKTYVGSPQSDDDYDDDSEHWDDDDFDFNPGVSYA